MPLDFLTIAPVITSPSAVRPPYEDDPPLRRMSITPLMVGRRNEGGCLWHLNEPELTARDSQLQQEQEALQSPETRQQCYSFIQTLILHVYLQKSCPPWSCLSIIGVTRPRSSFPQLLQRSVPVLYWQGSAAGNQETEATW